MPYGSPWALCEIRQEEVRLAAVYPSNSRASQSNACRERLARQPRSEEIVGMDSRTGKSPARQEMRARRGVRGGTAESPRPQNLEEAIRAYLVSGSMNEVRWHKVAPFRLENRCGPRRSIKEVTFGPLDVAIHFFLNGIPYNVRISFRVRP